MKPIRTVVTVLTTVGLALAASVAPAAAAGETTRTGSLTGTVRIYDFCGPNVSKRLAGTYDYAMPGKLIIGSPITDEPNRFHLAFATNDLAAVGAVGLDSAVRLNAGSGPVTLTYWRLTTNGTRFTGELTDPHLNEAAAINLFNNQQPLIPCRPEMGQLPMPLALAAGSRISGTADSFDLKAVTTDGMTELGLHFTASS
ncbi:hypothetical protein [Actinoplanes regularis]|uniref:Secreted protein n=1 Tax=Actinoplanes regularis TaxID=52697 RepID=A0A239JFP6_9ACTN|nr:hypothetical protein [Actinoplanes regularis]GIE91996.1 hypothetical protein Are01nite_84760 [Actinoplanes regularis]SNT04637.1 hypothetical protein SAMN06264365_13514 [Actinoplanes regularis]